VTVRGAENTLAALVARLGSTEVNDASACSNRRVAVSLETFRITAVWTGEKYSTKWRAGVWASIWFGILFFEFVNGLKISRTKSK
jgi:hypothetical protein